MNASIVAAIVAIVIAAIIFVILYRRKMGGRPVPRVLRPGQSLPSFSGVDEHGNAVDSESLRGSPAVILFVRGNWCPFCSRQVADLTKHYKAINDLGARLILVTPKPLATTRRVAEFFDVEFEFWLDSGLTIAEQLGLLLPSGVPSDYREEYGENTLWPAYLVVDSDGIIRYSSVSKMIVDRPNPQKFVRVLRSL